MDESEPPRPVEVTPRSAPPLLEVSFHNPVAVRLGFAMAGIAALLCSLPYLGLGFIIWWMAAGFCSVYFYHRRTGQFLTVRNGMKLGWMTGVLTFVVITVLLTVSTIPAAVSKGGLGAMYREQFHNMPLQDPNVEKMLLSPAGLATIMLLSLLFLFAFITLFTSAGGALGAKIVNRD